MNLQAYISSGVLELYVHGLATPEEVREVEAMAEQYPEVKQEIEAIQRALEGYVSSHAVQPPAGLKDKIINRLDDAPKGRTKGRPQADDRQQPQHSHPLNSASNRGTGSSLVAIIPWLLGLALMGICIAAFLFWKQADRADEQLKAAEAQLEQQQKACEEEKAKAAKVNEQFIALRHWATKPIQMKGTELGGDAFAVVYWNNVKKTAFLDVVKLPTPPVDKQYQLWAIVNGKPTDMGVFDIAANHELQDVPFIESPQAFAVTLEPKGGSQSPTLDQMYMVGAVGKS